jgi:hypothetical protein
MKTTILLTVILFATSILTASAQKVVHDNGPGATALATFQATVIRPLNILPIEQQGFSINLGVIEPSSTKPLGDSYNCKFHVTGMPNSVFYFNMTPTLSPGITLNGVRWKLSLTGPNNNWSDITLPSSATLNNEGDCYLMVYPESMTADNTAGSGNVVVTFNLSCKYNAF